MHQLGNTTKHGKNNTAKFAFASLKIEVQLPIVLLYVNVS